MVLFSLLDNETMHSLLSTLIRCAVASQEIAIEQIAAKERESAEEGESRAIVDCCALQFYIVLS